MICKNCGVYFAVDTARGLYDDSSYCLECVPMRAAEALLPAILDLGGKLNDIAMTLREIRTLLKDQAKSAQVSLMSPELNQAYLANLIDAFGIDVKKEQEALLREIENMPPAGEPPPDSVGSLSPDDGRDSTAKGLPACDICGKPGGH